MQLQELRTLNYRRRLEQIFQRRYIQWNELFPSFYSTEWRSSTSSRVEPLTDLCQLHAGLERRLARPYSVALQQQRPVKARKEPAFFVKESSGQKRLLLKASRGQLAAAKHLSASLAIVNGKCELFTAGWACDSGEGQGVAPPPDNSSSTNF